MIQEGRGRCGRRVCVTGQEVVAVREEQKEGKRIKSKKDIAKEKELELEKGEEGCEIGGGGGRGVMEKEEWNKERE